MASITELKWQFLTGVVNNIKSPNQFLRKLWFGDSGITLPTETIEIGVVSRGREIAPFVRRNAEAIMVGGHDRSFQSVEAPNIRIKRPFQPSPLLFGRQPGTVIFSPGADYQMSAVQAHIQRDMQGMSDMITNAEEYLTAMAIQGAISYEVADEEKFSITFPRLSTHNITLTTFWDDATPTKTDLGENFHTVKRLLAEDGGVALTDCVLGETAASQFRLLVRGGYVKQLTNYLYVQGGNVTFMEQFRDDGVIYMGNLEGCRIWEYARSATLKGSTVPMIRAKYAEFFGISPAADRQMYYGAIADTKAFQGNLFQSRRFSKSWEQEDPSAIIALTHSRPLPVPRRPDCSVSMKVISGD